ncbi:MAG: nucleotide sugar dehydrogenase [Bacteroidales bacterium]|nr:nucleotide sugar dehydrogenase [Bacteroidales bacterium]
MKNICVVGLGYVGLPLAKLFATKYHVVGYDTDASHVRALCNAVQADANLSYTSNISDIASCNVFIVAVPTPVDASNHPDLQPLREASGEVGNVLKKGDLVVYESTVYPGVTEEVCLPVLEETSHLRINVDFYLGYSPERINPGDEKHGVADIVKVTSGSNEEAAEMVDALYASVLKNGTCKVSSIRVAEASKIMENTQRDVNIALMNEFAKIFNAMGIDTREVIDAASTKWNFVRNTPGLVGGHCISVDPYYLIEKAQAYGVLPHIMVSARQLNDSMGAYVAHRLIRLMNERGLPIKGASILVLGFTFKENCADTRNTKVFDVVQTLRPYSKNITIVDPCADPMDVKKKFDVEVLPSIPKGQQYDAAILAVPHDAFRSIHIRSFVPRPGVVYDVKGFFPKDETDARL